MPDEQEKQGIPAGERGTNGISELQSSISDLAEKLKEAEALRRKKIQKDISEREELIITQKRIFEIVQDAKAQLDYFTEKHGADPHVSEEERRLVGELENKVEQIRKQYEEVRDRVDVLSKRPEVLDALHEEAQEVHGRKEKEAGEMRKKEKRVARGRLVIEELVKLENEFKDLRAEVSRIQEEINEKDRRFREIVHQSFLKVKKVNFEPIYENVNVDHVDFYERMLKKARATLGFFNRSDKAAIDAILQGAVPIMRELVPLHKKVHELVMTEYLNRERKKRLNTEFDEIIESFDFNSSEHEYLRGFYLQRLEYPYTHPLHP